MSCTKKGKGLFWGGLCSLAYRENRGRLQDGHTTCHCFTWMGGQCFVCVCMCDQDGKRIKIRMRMAKRGMYIWAAACASPNSTRCPVALNALRTLESKTNKTRAKHLGTPFIRNARWLLFAPDSVLAAAQAKLVNPVLVFPMAGRTDGFYFVSRSECSYVQK